MALEPFVPQRLRQHAAAAMVIAVATFAGCASSSDSAASETAATTEAVTLTPNAIGVMLTEAGLECSDLQTKDADPPSTTEVAAPMSVAALCTVKGHEITITVFATAADVQLAHKQMDSYRSQLASVGYTQLAWSESGPDDRVWVQVENDDFTPSPTDEDRAILEGIASALGGAVMTFDV